MDILIVGAGLSGCVIARELAEAQHNITIVERRDHLGGNCYDYKNKFGIRVHRYGPHLFHTSNSAVFQYLSRFTEWIEYKHKVKALLEDGRLVTLPVNKETAEIVGRENIIDIFYRPYTKKMWGEDIEHLDPSILERVPIRNDLNEFYFPQDKYQTLPRDGYTNMISNLVDHPRIRVELGGAFCKGMDARFDHCFNSMSIDEYFDYCFGMLKYRSIKFHNFDVPIPDICGVPTINFTHNGPFTRVTEWKHLPGHGLNPHFTSLTIEEPCDFIENQFERYYPIKDKSGENRRLYKRYADLAPENITFIGRCGLYAYLDMHQAVSASLAVATKFVEATS